MLKRLQNALKDYDAVMCDLYDAEVSDEDLQAMMEEVEWLEQNIWQDKQVIEDKLERNRRDRG